MWGRYDGLVPFGFAAHVKRTLPSAQHLVLECGHVPQIERPVRFNRLVSDFLRRSGTLP